MVDGNLRQNKPYRVNYVNLCKFPSQPEDNTQSTLANLTCKFLYSVANVYVYCTLGNLMCCFIYLLFMTYVRVKKYMITHLLLCLPLDVTRSNIGKP